MEFDHFTTLVSKIKNLELPGEEIQLKMAPVERLQELKSAAKALNNARKAGVMALFYPGVDNRAHLILILRKTYKGVHSAQVGFPGGRMEQSDASLKETALRETEEEIGVPQKHITVIKELTEMYIPPSNYLVQPYMGITHSYPEFVPQASEVEALIEVPLHHFLDDSIIITQKITTSYAIDIDVPAFDLNGHLVWGATAMILSEVRQLLKQVI